jgi:hypothetical protein
MSSTELPRETDVQEAFERLRALDPDSAAVVESWARQPEADVVPAVAFDRAIRVHVAHR